MIDVHDDVCAFTIPTDTPPMWFSSAAFSPKAKAGNPFNNNGYVTRRLQSLFTRILTITLGIAEISMI